MSISNLRIMQCCLQIVYDQVKRVKPSPDGLQRLQRYAENTDFVNIEVNDLRKRCL